MRRHRRAFTLIELMSVVVIVAILAGVAMPKFFDYRLAAREAACKGYLGSVRVGIANFYAHEVVVVGTPGYPTLAALTAAGSVMTEIMPDNPFDHSGSAVTDPNGVEQVSKANADARNVVNGGTNGWAYFPGTGGDEAIFYANTDSNDGTIDEHDF